MAETVKGDTGPGNRVPHQGDHDRVVMLSLGADGTPNQHNPEIIGDRDSATEAAKRQFAEQAVSAVDVAERGVTASTGAETVGQDPGITDLQKKHDSAAAAAESAAESTVRKLFTEESGDTAPAAGKAGTDGKPPTK